MCIAGHKYIACKMQMAVHMTIAEIEIYQRKHKNDAYDNTHAVSITLTDIFIFIF